MESSDAIKLDYIDLITDNPVVAQADDTESQSKMGVKEAVVSREEVLLNVDAQRLAELELERRKHTQVRGRLVVPGNKTLKEGMVLRVRTPAVSYTHLTLPTN